MNQMLCLHQVKHLCRRARWGEGRGAGAWGAQFHGPFGLAALGVNNNHKDVTITHWNRSEWTAMCDVNVWRVPTERENYGESKECWTIVKLVFRLRLFYGLFSTQCSTFVWRGNGNGNGLPSRKLFSVTIFTVYLGERSSLERGKEAHWTIKYGIIQAFIATCHIIVVAASFQFFWSNSINPKCPFINVRNAEASIHWQT